MEKASQQKSRWLEQLDKHFQREVGKKPLRWLDAFDLSLALRGLAWVSENRRGKHFRRLPNRSDKYLTEGVRHFSHCPAGVFLSFFTNAADISVRMSVEDFEQMHHMPATGMAGAELYFRAGETWHPVAMARPSLSMNAFECSLIKNASRQQREFRLYLPLYKKVNSLALGVEPGAIIKPAPAQKGNKPILFYGTSITQGGCANTPGSNYVSSIGRILDTEVINLGFSGNGKGEPALARLMREIDAEIFVLDFIANAEIETLDTVLPEFIKLLRARHRHTPIALLGCPAFDLSLLSAKVYATLDRKRDITLRTYLNAKSAGDRNLHFIDGNSLLPAGVTGSYVDGVHPTSHGFAIIAERLAPQLHAIRFRP